MFGHTFYHGTIRKYVILFGTLFNDVYINRPSPSNDTIRTVKVPISYGPKEKTLARINADPALNRPVAMVLPRMSFEMLSMNYAGDRKLTTINRNVRVDAENEDVLKYQYMPVPYDFSFELSIMVQNADDGTRILEQILPFFTPDWTTTVNLIPEMGLKYDIPVILNSVDSTDTYEGDYETRRALIWTLTFTLKGFIFGPIKQQAAIKQAITRAIAASNNFDWEQFALYDDQGNLISAGNPASPANTQGVDVDATFTIQPGLLANGSPTTNVSSSVDIGQITANSNYGYIVTRQ